MIDGRDRLEASEAHAVALDCIEAGIEAARPDRVVGRQVTREGETLTVAGSTYDLDDYERVVVLGGGKAADAVAAELESVLGERLDNGLVVATDPAATETVDVAEGAHPVPDAAGRDAAQRVFDRASEQGSGTLVLVPVTGGGSALLPLPAGDISLGDLRAVTEELVESGAAIAEINAVRKHLSEIKGGGLARAAAPATVVGLLFSDVVGDDPGVVASGPTAPDDSTYDDALDVLDRYDVDVPAAVRAYLTAGADGERAETPDSGAALGRVDNHVLASSATALEGARAAAAAAGYEPLLLSSRVRGESTEAALSLLAIAEEVRESGTPVEPPAVLLSGGETTVTLLGSGKGGPNLEFALRVAIEDAPGVVCAAVDTDGEDGSTDAAGAIVDDETLRNPRAARSALMDNRSHPLLEDTGTLIRTGPTGTNVNDLRVFVVSG